jgi:8-oxo-dGTP diphosphatase
MNKNLKTKNLKDPLAYFRPSVATDGVVFKVQNNELYILLVKRGISETGITKELRPYKDYWALPGGFIRGKESAEEAVIRELKEETNLNLKINKNKTSIYQTGFYSTPDRDTWSFDGGKKGLWKQTMSVAFAIITQASHTPVASTDAKEAKYIKVSDVIEKKIEKKVLAFDHNKILEDALDFMVNQMALRPIALDFCDEKFTIGDVRAVYESFWKLTHNIDAIELGNFQNKILKQVDQEGNPVINPMPNKPENKRAQEGKGAPALLYSRNEKANYLSYIMLPTQKRI